MLFLTKTIQQCFFDLVDCCRCLGTLGKTMMTMRRPMKKRTPAFTNKNETLLTANMQVGLSEKPLNVSIVSI